MPSFSVSVNRVFTITLANDFFTRISFRKDNFATPSTGAAWSLPPSPGPAPPLDWKSMQSVREVKRDADDVPLFHAGAAILISE